MIAVDTNVLLRALLDDPQAPEQCATARELIVAAGSVAISAVVFLESMWTLSRSFAFPRRQVAETGMRLLEHPRYRIESRDLFVGAMRHYLDRGIDFGDAVALEQARQDGLVLHTFDRKLARCPGAQLATKPSPPRA